VIGEGVPFTVSVVAVPQPDGIVYDIVVIPNEKVVTNPVDGFIVATAGVTLPQVPPGVASDMNVVDPIHIAPGPVIGAGTAFTVIGNVA